MCLGSLMLRIRGEWTSSKGESRTACSREVSGFAFKGESYASHSRGVDFVQRGSLALRAQGEFKFEF